MLDALLLVAAVLLVTAIATWIGNPPATTPTTVTMIDHRAVMRDVVARYVGRWVQVTFNHQYTFEGRLKALDPLIEFEFTDERTVTTTWRPSEVTTIVEHKHAMQLNAELEAHVLERAKAASSVVSH